MIAHSASSRAVLKRNFRKEARKGLYYYKGLAIRW
jgi:hypothetical protein